MKKSWKIITVKQLQYACKCKIYLILNFPIFPPGQKLRFKLGVTNNINTTTTVICSLHIDYTFSFLPIIVIKVLLYLSSRGWYIPKREI